MAVKLSAGVVVSANDRMDVWQPGYVIVRDGQIAEAGPGTGPEGDFAECVAAPSSIVMPGLVNGHSHSPSNLLKGTWSRLPLEIWRQYIRAGWREYSDEAIYVSAQLGHSSTKITADMLTVKGPGTGLKPGVMPLLVGVVAEAAIAGDTLVPAEALKWRRS
jgi:hypothetical protein